MRGARGIVAVILASAFVPYVQAEPVAARSLSYADLVRRLYALDALAEPPVPGERSGSWSSCDRAARYDATKDTYVDWHANADGGGAIRREGDDVVAAELEGPGVIWRIWSARPANGAIRFCIDGNEPVAAMPFSSLFLPSNPALSTPAEGPFAGRELLREMAKGWNSFVPIPYQKSCKVLLGKNWGLYFQITYTKFPEGWTVPSFRGSFDAEEKKALLEADGRWARRGMPSASPAGATVEKTVTLGPRANEAVVTVEGARAITGIVCDVPGVDAGELERALRELAIEIRWDGDTSPAVWSPLGDLFGSGPGRNEFRSLPCGMTPEGMYCAWYMPFARRAEIRLVNDGGTARQVALKVIHEPLTRPANTLLRFHAKWHRDHYGRGGVGRYAADRWPDWPVLLADGGPGRFCGVALHVWNPLHSWDKPRAARYRKKVSEICPVPRWFETEVMPNYWWGEGDEKFFVDGEKYPSTFGTGSEDYFGYAWGTPQCYDGATQCQTRNAGNTGHLSMARFQVADNVPFQSSFEAAIEKYHGNNWPLLHACTVYWYQAPGVTDAYPPLPVGERVGYETQPEPAGK